MSNSTLRTSVPLASEPRTPLVASGVLGMLIFVGTEVMLFAGLISAFTVYRSSALVWPPPEQPRLPVEETAINTAALLLSGVLLFFAGRIAQSGDRKRAAQLLLGAIALGAFFVVFQGAEWISLIGQGLTLTSSNLGGFFYLIIGLHALHAIVALGVLVYAWQSLRSGYLPRTLLAAAEVFWDFVVGVWPVLYLRVYL
ncbi:MAG: heme-copper oxidase subunit III [bacterium]|nr:heme-copper oxidase subunit III [bacterium]